MRHRLLATTLLFVEIAPAFASEEANGGHAEHEGIPWLLLFFTAVNFSLFLLLLGRAVLPAIRTWAIDRRDRIVDELQRAAAARAEAEKLKVEWEERMGRLDKELAEIRNQALADAQRERERILKTAQDTAASVSADAEKAAAQEVRRAQTELRQQIAREAIALAGDLIRKGLTEADQKRFVTEFLREVRP